MPGAESGMHRHPYPAFMYVMEGTLIVEVKDGESKTYQAGEALISSNF